MNIRTVKAPQERFDTHYISELNIQSYGRDNLYPQRCYMLIQNSPTGGTCLDRYMTFIEGNGFDSTAFSEFVCNRAGDTVDDIYEHVVHDMAYYHGFALHVNYDMAGRIVEVQHVPFEQTRLEEEDENGNVRYIVIHPDWTGKKTRKGERIPRDLQHCKKIFTFNPIPQVVLSQIESCGGIQNYRGQILWFSMDGRFVYPKPIYDKIITPLSTDEGLDNVKYRNVRNNFLSSGMLVHKKGQNVVLDENGNVIGDDKDKKDNDLSRSLQIFQGDTQACAIMDVTVEADEDVPKFETFEGNNFDKKFDSTENSTTERVYSAFGQEPWFCIRKGKLGFSGQVISDAYEYYNSYVSKERRAISRVFKKIFEHWHIPVNDSNNYEIQPLVYIYNEDSNK